MVVQMSQSENSVCSQVRLAILGKDSTHPLVFIAYGGLWVKFWTQLEYSLILCIIDTDGSCKPMNLVFLWICLVGITTGNNPGTEREILTYMVRDSPTLSFMVNGKPPGHGIQFQSKEILLSYICQRSALGRQSLRSSENNLSLDACLYSMDI